MTFNELSQDVTIFNLLKAFQSETFAKLNCMRIGIIDEVLDDNEVRCSITNKKLLRTNDDGTPVWQDYPPIYAKVWFMGSANSGIDFQLSTETPCLLLFNDREFTSYFDTGVVSPLSNVLMHDLTYCICIPLYQPTIDGDFNIKTDGNMNINSDTTNLTSSTEINITAPIVNIEATTVNINGVLNINGSPYLDHTHTSGAEGSPTSGVI